MFNLDLATYSYQLFSQTLAWPFDPYYEDLGDGRDAFITRVKSWAQETGEAQATADLGLAAFRGPGILSGFDNNDSHDPIVYQYSRLHPWSDTLTHPLRALDRIPHAIPDHRRRRTGVDVHPRSELDARRPRGRCSRHR